MRRDAVIALGLVCLFLNGGCSRSAVPVTGGAAKPNVAAEKSSAAKPATIKTPPAGDAVSNATIEKPIEVSPAEAAGAPEKNVVEKGDDEVGTRERVALLTLGGPLVVDVWITTDCRSHVDVFEEQVNEILDAADVDKDGRPTWKELAGNKTFLEGKLPDGSPADDRLAETLAERYDLNRDRRIQPGEAAAWLGRDAGRSASAFEVRSSRSYFPNPRATSRVWQLLDADRDGQLSADEIGRAPAKLWSVDADDDRVIAQPELATLREQLEAAGGQMTRPSREANRDAALHLEPKSDVDRLEYVLIDLYSPRRQLGRASFPELGRLFEMLDANQDALLERQELAELLTVESQLELSVDFGKSDSNALGTAKLELRGHAPEITVVAQPAGDRLILSLGETRLIVSAHDFPQPPNANQYGPNRHIRLMVHDQCDALCEELDVNGDALLAEREIASIPDRLSKRDANGDGHLAPHELPFSLIVAFMRGEQPQEQSFYLPAFAAGPNNSAAAPAWFRHADFNGDGDVSRREFLGAAEQFAKLDSDEDGYIDADEAAAK